MKNFTYILFDADDTLFDYQKSEKIALSRTLSNHGISDNHDAIHRNYKTINSDLWKEYEQGKIHREKLRLIRFERLFSGENLRVDTHLFAKSYLTQLSQLCYLKPHAYELVTRLSRHYRLGILTNGFASVQKPRFQKSVLYPHFETITISDEVNCTKPDRKIFDIALAQANITDPVNTLMVGDSLNADIQGGLNADLYTCWINWAGIKKAEKVTPHQEVHSLTELEKWIFEEQN